LITLEKEHFEAMFVYAYKLSEGFYDENREKKSEKYYLIAINKELTDSMFS
jgi:hypothetical protein